jgi:hypothetical protein
MSNLLSALFFICLALLIRGFFHPATLKKTTILYSVICLILLFIIGRINPDMMRVVSASSESTTSDKAAGKPVGSPSDRARLRAMFRRCDTSYQFIDDSTQYDHDTGWVIPGPYQSMLLPVDNITKHIWGVPTYTNTGFSTGTLDSAKLLPIYQKVYVQHGYMEHKDCLRGFFVVNPVGTDETYNLDIRCFTLKDPGQCSLLQKIKNGGLVKARYLEPQDPNKAARVQGWGDNYLDIPPHATIILYKHAFVQYKRGPEREIFTGYVYTESGQYYNIGDFDVSTLIELK